jgi:hypothetical protein
MTPQRLQEIKFLIDSYPAQVNEEWERGAKNELFTYLETLTAQVEALTATVMRLTELERLARAEMAANELTSVKTWTMAYDALHAYLAAEPTPCPHK